MKKFLKNIVIFALVMVFCDMCFGYAMSFISSHAKGGCGAKRYYVCNSTKEEILMFGSSRMHHHYVPQIIGDSLGMSCYNCGEDGTGIIYSYGLLQYILKRYTPRVIICDIFRYDIEIDNHSKYIGFLKPYASDPDVKDLIVSVSPSDRFKLYSNMYRYNSTCISLLGGMVSTPTCKGGFEPFSEVMDYEPDLTKDEIDSKEIDKFKEKCLRSFIDICHYKNIKLIFVVSPRYHGADFGSPYSNVERLCAEKEVPFIDCYGMIGIAEQKRFFKDPAHLNSDGAYAFTDSLITRIKPIVCTIHK